MTGRRGTAEERFWRHVDATGDCWEWTGGLYPSGYGHFHPVRTESIAAHRFSFQLLVGPIPAGLELDHLCRNRLCVNPDHLEPVTTAENVRRGYGASAKAGRQTHCVRGHAFVPANTQLTREGHRRCRECHRMDARRAAHLRGWRPRLAVAPLPAAPVLSLPGPTAPVGGCRALLGVARSAVPATAPPPPPA